MENMENMELNAIHNLIGQQLRRQASANTVEDSFLDDDVLTAYVEGRLTERENQRVVKHLLKSDFHRQMVADLMRFEEELGEQEMTMPVVVGEAGRVRRFLESFTVRFFSSDEESVFAYHAQSENQDEELLNEEPKAEETNKPKPSGK